MIKNNNLKNITIYPATIKDYATIQNMARFYVYDMSEYCGHMEGWEIPEDGLYECLDFKSYFKDKNAYPFLIKKNKELVGFVIINNKGSDETTQFNMAQFFILRKFKKMGIGSHIAKICFNKFQGIWEVMVLPENIGAYKFWCKVIGDYTNGNYTKYTKTVEHLENCAKNIFKFTTYKK